MALSVGSETTRITCFRVDCAEIKIAQVPDFGFPKSLEYDGLPDNAMINNSCCSIGHSNFRTRRQRNAAHGTEVTFESSTTDERGGRGQIVPLGNHPSRVKLSSAGSPKWAASESSDCSSGVHRSMTGGDLEYTGDVGVYTGETTVTALVAVGLVVCKLRLAICQMENWTDRVISKPFG